MVSIDSSLAMSRKPQVFINIVSASLGSSVITKFSFCRPPRRSSESTNAFAQPRLIRFNLCFEEFN